MNGENGERSIFYSSLHSAHLPIYSLEAKRELVILGSKIELLQIFQAVMSRGGFEKVRGNHTPRL